MEHREQTKEQREGGSITAVQPVDDQEERDFEERVLRIVQQGFEEGRLIVQRAGH